MIPLTVDVPMKRLPWANWGLILTTVAVSLAVPLSHKLLAVGVGVLAVGGAVIAFAVVAYLLDDGDLRMVLARLPWLARLSGVRQHSA